MSVISAQWWECRTQFYDSAVLGQRHAVSILKNCGTHFEDWFFRFKNLYRNREGAHSNSNPKKKSKGFSVTCEHLTTSKTSKPLKNFSNWRSGVTVTLNKLLFSLPRWLNLTCNVLTTRNTFSTVFWEISQLRRFKRTSTMDFPQKKQLNENNVAMQQWCLFLIWKDFSKHPRITMVTFYYAYSL